jgi:uncharacterized protein
MQIKRIVANFKQILSDQKEELNKLNISSLIPREAEELWKKETGLIRIITGVRRSGKSTLALHHLVSTHFAYVNFDDERLTDLKSEELNELLTAVYEVYGDVKCFFFDEIQNTPNWSLFVNRLQRAGGRVIVTGSNSKLLSTELATHLTGRFTTIELFPFSFHEFLVARNSVSRAQTTREKGIRNSMFEEYARIGGFPEIIKGEEPISYARDLFYSIINRDILFRHKINHTRAFKDLSVFLVINTGKEISYNRIKNIFSLGSAHTARNYVDFLEEAYLISTIGKFSYKHQETLRNRKSYVIDIAFYQSLMPAGSPNTGFIIETLVFQYLFRFRQTQGIELFYYKGKNEVDFVIKRPGGSLKLIQVCKELMAPGTLKREVKGLIEASEILHCDDLTIINDHLDEIKTIENKNIRFVPVIDWLSRGEVW